MGAYPFGIFRTSLGLHYALGSRSKAIDYVNRFPRQNEKLNFLFIAEYYFHSRHSSNYH